MKKITLIIAGILIANFLFAQSLLQDADTSFFKSKDFKTAAGVYKKALKVYLKNTDSQSEEKIKYIYFQLGECARMENNNFLESKNWYEKAITAGSDSDIANLHLGEALMMSGDYTGAKNYIEKYLKLEPASAIGKLRLESCELNLKAAEKPIYEVKNIRSLNTSAGDYGVGYFKDNKIIFSSDNTAKGFSHLFESTYDTIKGQWSKPEEVSGSINTNSNEGTFAFDAKTNLGYYTQCNGSSGKKKQCNIMVAQYNEEKNTWEGSKLFDFNSEAFRSQQQALSSDGKTLYFVSDMPGGYGGTDLYVIKKSGSAWGKPVNLGITINTVGNEGFPFISGDTLLVFSSDGHPGFGGQDIFMSTINKNGTYGKPVNMMQPINSSADDFGLIFKKSKDEGLFCSNRVTGMGEDDIYSYNKIAVILTASGNIKDKATLKNVDDVIVTFKGDDGSLDSVSTDSKGNYEYTKINSNVKYSLRITKNGYLNDSKTFAVNNEKYSKTFNKANGTDLDFLIIKKAKEEVKIDNIYYDYDKWELREESKIELNKLVNVLVETPEINVQINAHTDERGEKDYNIELSQKRAQSVVDYLISKGISSNRLIAKGYGSSMPIKKNAQTEQQHQLNRRTTFNILSSSEIAKLSENIPVKPNISKPVAPSDVTNNTNIATPVSSDIPAKPITQTDNSNNTNIPSTTVTTKAETPKPVEVKTDVAKAETPKPVEVKTDVAKAETPKPVEVKTDAVKTETPKTVEADSDEVAFVATKTVDKKSKNKKIVEKKTVETKAEEADTTDEENAVAIKTVEKKSKDKKPVEKKTIEKNPVSTKTVAKKSDETETNASNNTETTDNSSDVEKNFFIIAKTFPSEEKANDGVDELKSKGYPDAVVVKTTANTWNISYKAYATKEEATKELPALKKINPAAKIFEKKPVAAKPAAKPVAPKPAAKPVTTKPTAAKPAAKKTDETETNNTKDTTTTANVNNTNVEKNFFILEKTYPTEQKANDAVDDLINDFPDAVVVGKTPSNTWNVAFKAFATKAEATKELPAFKKFYPAAKIFEKKPVVAKPTPAKPAAKPAPAKPAATKPGAAKSSTKKSDETETVVANDTAADNSNVVKNFFILEKTYPSEQKAKEGVTALKSKGYKNALIVGKNVNNSWSIAYKAYATKDEAMKDLPNFKKVNPAAKFFEKK